jgi:hypothetical protein
MHTASDSGPGPLRLVAELAITGLDHSLLSLEEGADFYEGLSTLLPSPGSDAARYAATCLRECQRARQEILSAIQSPERTRTT